MHPNPVPAQSVSPPVLDRLMNGLSLFTMALTIPQAMSATVAVPSMSPAADQANAPLALAQTIVLPDVRGRIDHLDVDADGERLFVAALGNDSVEVIDLRGGRRSARITGLHEPQGLAYLPDAKRLYVASGGNGRVDVYSGTPPVAGPGIDGLDDADNVRYERTGGRLYVGYGKALAVVDAASARIVGRIPLAGHPESFQLETRGERIFVNVPDAQQIAVLDRNKRAAIATWKLEGAEANFPMALDESHHRLFVGTRRPAELLVYDTDTGRRVGRLAIGGDADDLFYDAERRRIYAICGEGVVDIVHQDDADHYRSEGRVATARGARTGLFVPARAALFVAVPKRDGSSAEIRVYKVR